MECNGSVRSVSSSLIRMLTLSAKRSVLVFAISLMAIPMAKIVNATQTVLGDFGLLVSGVTFLCFVCYLTHATVSRPGYATDPFFYVLALCMFSSAIDIFIGLENDGYVTGIVSRYLIDGEPYLKTAHGTMICYWDGFGHYLMYILMLACMALQRDFLLIGLYWVGSFGHSMLVFIPGNVIGHHDLHWSFLLNIPYIIIPFICGSRFLREREEQTKKENETKRKYQDSPRFLNAVFAGVFLSFIGIACFRALAVLGSNKPLFRNYIQHYEPYMLDPNAYPKMQMLVYLFYFVPFYVLVLYEFFASGSFTKPWLTNWSVINAGAAAQAQIAYIGGSLHHSTFPSFRLPEETNARTVFWVVNLSLLVIPQAFAWYCTRYNSKQNSKTR